MILPAAATAEAAINPNSIIVPSRTLIIPQSNLQLQNNEQIVAANGYEIPKSITIQVASAAGGGAVPTVVSILNQDVGDNITDNGSGPASITYTYQDGFSGAVVNRILGNARGGMGAVCFGLAIRMNVTAGGAGDPAGLAATNPAFVLRNAFGRSMPLDINATSDQSRSDQDDSISVWRVIQNLPRFAQLQFTIPVGDTATVTLYTDPNFRN